MRSILTSYALVRQFTSAAAVLGKLPVSCKIMELPHTHDGKKHVPVPSGNLLCLLFVG